MSSLLSSTVPIALTGSNQVARAVPSDYRGFTIWETAGGNAVVTVYDNASAGTGTILEAISLGPNESAREMYTQGGISAANGVYVKVVSGAVAGSVRVNS